MDKLTIATKVLLKLIETNKTGFDAEGIAAYSFEIADAMQAEADKRESKERPDVLKEEWQPDWSQAPDDANYWAMDKNGQCDWYVDQPLIKGDEWIESSVFVECAPSFNYQGNWQDSLRKRPEARGDVD